MRLVALLLCLASIPIAHADSVSGFCERDGTKLTFTDGIAFADARDSDGTLTTTIYLTAKPIDRKALAACAACGAELPENTFLSPRGDLVEAQRTATAEGWVELAHVGGELDMTTIVNIMHLASDGVLTGLDGGNGRVDIDSIDDKRVVGHLTSEDRGEGYNQTDMRCDVRFELAVGWPK